MPVVEGTSAAKLRSREPSKGVQRLAQIGTRSDCLESSDPGRARALGALATNRVPVRIIEQGVVGVGQWLIALCTTLWRSPGERRLVADANEEAETAETSHARAQSNGNEALRHPPRGARERRGPNVEDRERRQSSVDVPPANDVCAICREWFVVPVQANCGHWFCGECILRAWRHASLLQPCPCPICRRVINLLIVSQSAFQSPLSPHNQQVIHDVSAYNGRFGGGPISIWQRIRDMPLLLQRLMWELWDPHRALRLLNNARILGCLIISIMYTLLPFDIIPEGILGILGLLDDALVLLFFGFQLSIVYRNMLLQQGPAH
ncbi:hypothetical protein CBR_g38544 [Chara braunii]|uniref:E3 ubiquitin-protein ligase RNF170 n=1 Tax=Chara braunii TaxID=69332 RepID=A0A388JP16_CHABU|nr:hypothetical protein CBR_g38544 [Chara braunii]|eukprot:GBG59521.1 hypothetical protein CBR_g38544 [Chara braunii]